MKRILSLLLTVVLALTSFSLSAMAAAEPVELSTTGATKIQLENYVDDVNAEEGVATTDNSGAVLAVIGTLTGSDNFIVEIPVNVVKTGAYRLEYRVTTHNLGYTGSQILDSTNATLLDVFDSDFYDSYTVDNTMRAGGWQEARIYNRDIFLEANENEVLKIKSNSATAKIGIDYIKLTPLPDEEIGDWTASDEEITGEGDYTLSIPFTRTNPQSEGYLLIGAMMDKNGSVEVDYYDIDSNLTDESAEATVTFAATEDTAKIYAAVIKDIENPTLISNIKEITNSSNTVNKESYYTVAGDTLTEAATGALVLTFEGSAADIEKLVSFEYSNQVIAEGENGEFNLNLSGRASSYKTMIAAYGENGACLDNELYSLSNPQALVQMKSDFASLVALEDDAEFQVAYETFVNKYMVEGSESLFEDIYGTEAPISEMTVYEDAEDGFYSYSEIKNYVFALKTCFQDSGKDLSNNLTTINDAENLFKASLFTYVMCEKGGNESVADSYGNLLYPLYNEETVYESFNSLVSSPESVTADNVYNCLLNASLREELTRALEAEEKKVLLTELSDKNLLGVEVSEFGIFFEETVEEYTFDLEGVTGDALKNGLIAKAKEPKNLVESVFPEEDAQYVSNYNKIRIDFLTNVKADTLNAENITIDGVTLSDSNFVKGDTYCEITGLDLLLEADNTYEVTVSSAVQADLLGGISGIEKKWSFTTCTSVLIDSVNPTTIQLEDYVGYVNAADGVATTGISGEGYSSSCLSVNGEITNSDKYILEIPVNVTKTGAYKLEYRVTTHNNGYTGSQILDSNNKVLMTVHSGSTSVNAGTMNAGGWQSARIYSKDVYLEGSASGVLKIRSDALATKIGIDYIKLTPIVYEAAEISSTAETVIEAETYSLLFANGATVKEHADASGGKYVEVSDTSRIEARVSIPVNVKKSGIYKAEFKTRWSGSESKTWLGAENSQTVHVDREPFVQNGFFRTYYKNIFLSEGEQEITFNIGAGDSPQPGSTQILAYIDGAVLTPVPDIELGAWTASAEEITAAGSYTLSIPYTVNNTAKAYYLIGAEMKKDGSVTIDYSQLANEGSEATVALTADENTSKIYAAVISDIEKPVLISDIKKIENSSNTVNKESFYTVTGNSLSKAAIGALILTFEGTTADINKLVSFEYSSEAISQGESGEFCIKLSDRASSYRTMIAAYGEDGICIDNTLYRPVDPEIEVEMKADFALLAGKENKEEFLSAYEAFVKKYMVSGSGSYFEDVYGTEAPVFEMTVFENATEGYSYSEIADYVFALKNCFKDSSKEISNSLATVADAENLIKASLFAYVMCEKGGNEEVSDKYGSLLSPLYNEETVYESFKALVTSPQDITADGVYNSLLNASLREKLTRSADLTEKKELLTKLSDKNLLGVTVSEFDVFFEKAVEEHTFNLAGVTGDTLKNGLIANAKKPKNLIVAVSPKEGAEYVSDYNKIRIDFITKVKQDTLTPENIKIKGITLSEANFVKGENYCEITGLGKLLSLGRTYEVTVSSAVQADLLGGISGVEKKWSFKTSDALIIDGEKKTTIEFENYLGSVKQPAIASEGTSAEGYSSRTLSIIGDVADSKGVVLEIPVNIEKSGMYILEYRTTQHTGGWTTSKLLNSENEAFLDITKTPIWAHAGTINAGGWQTARIYTKPAYLEANANEVIKLSVATPAKVGMDYLSFTPVDDVTSGEWTVKHDGETTDEITQDGAYSFEIPFNFYRPLAEDKYYMLISKVDTTGNSQLYCEEFSYTDSYDGFVAESEKTFSTEVEVDSSTKRIYAAVVKNLDNPVLVSPIVEIERDIKENLHDVTYKAKTGTLHDDADKIIALVFKPGATELNKENLYLFGFLSDIKKDTEAEFKFVNPDSEKSGESIVKLAAFNANMEEVLQTTAKCYLVNETALTDFIADVNDLKKSNYDEFVNQYMLEASLQHSALYNGKTVEELSEFADYEKISEHVLMLKNSILNEKVNAQLKTAQDVSDLFAAALFTYSLCNDLENAKVLAEKYGTLIYPLYTKETDFDTYKKLLVKPTDGKWQTYSKKLLSAALREELLESDRERQAEIINNNAEVMDIKLSSLRAYASIARIVANFSFNIESVEESKLHSNLLAVAKSLYTPSSEVQSGGGSGGGASISSKREPAVLAPSVPNENAKKPLYNDIGSFMWANDAIEELSAAGIISGTGNGNFEPAREVKREEIIKMICEAFKIPSQTVNGEEKEFDFDDVSMDKWYYPYVKAAYFNGVVNGVTETSFGAGRSVTRQDVAAMIYRYMQVKKALTVVSEPQFTDTSEISDYALIPVAAMQEYGIITGFEDGSFNPHAPATRAEAAVMISRLIAHMKGVE